MFNVIPDNIAGKNRTCIKELEVLCNILYTTATTTKDSFTINKRAFKIETGGFSMTQILMESSLSIIDRIGLEPINTFYERNL